MGPIETRILTESDCYRAGRTIVPKGIMVHSTGVAQPDPEVFCRLWNRPGVEACVHAFVAESRILQTLPWNWRGWHAGTGQKGSANNTHISFECCEPAGQAVGIAGVEGAISTLQQIDKVGIHPKSSLQRLPSGPMCI